MNDSVREELQDKISSPSKRLHIEMIEDESPIEMAQNAEPAPEQNIFTPSAKPAPTPKSPAAPVEPTIERGGMTREFRGARRTSPILVEFQNKGNALPEWRLQMQNAVRQRREAAGGSAPAEKPVLIRGNATSGATALKTDAMPQQTPQVGTAVLENAVRRVEESRKRFAIHEGAGDKPLSPTPKGGARTFPIAVPKKTPIVTAPSPEPIPDSSFKEIVPELPPAKDLDTNKLPAIPKPEAVAETIAREEEEMIAVETVVEEAPVEEIAEIADFDEFDDIELELDDEDLELETDLETVDLKKAPVAAKPVALPLFPEEIEEIAEEVVIEEIVEETVEEPVAEVVAYAAPTVTEEVAPVEEVEVEEELFEDFEEEIHETTEPEFSEDNEDVVYEYEDEFSQGFIDDYEYEPEAVMEAETEEEDYEDLAPISMRFNAGLLDLIVGSAVSLLLLAPFIVSGGKWLSAPGLVAFAVTLLIVMFIYMTATIGFSGRTLGMKVLSLEMIDVEENEYPDFHQAALSSSLYLVSLVFCGVGFVTAFFNPERRALHDLLSGTVIVREY